MKQNENHAGGRTSRTSTAVTRAMATSPRIRENTKHEDERAVCPLCGHGVASLMKHLKWHEERGGRVTMEMWLMAAQAAPRHEREEALTRASHVPVRSK